MIQLMRHEKILQKSRSCFNCLFIEKMYTKSYTDRNKDECFVHQSQDLWSFVKENYSNSHQEVPHKVVLMTAAAL